MRAMLLCLVLVCAGCGGESAAVAVPDVQQGPTLSDLMRDIEFERDKLAEVEAELDDLTATRDQRFALIKDLWMTDLEESAKLGTPLTQSEEDEYRQMLADNEEVFKLQSARKNEAIEDLKHRIHELQAAYEALQAEQR